MVAMYKAFIAALDTYMSAYKMVSKSLDIDDMEKISNMIFSVDSSRGRL